MCSILRASEDPLESWGVVEEEEEEEEGVAKQREAGGRELFSH